MPLSKKPPTNEFEPELEVLGEECLVSLLPDEPLMLLFPDEPLL
jgi:hypothetical protein